MSDAEFNIDIAKNSESLHIAQDIYLRILNKAVEQTTDELLRFESALANNDLDQIQSISHKMKGDYDNLRITEMASIAKAINENSKTEKDQSKISQCFKEFVGYFNQLKNFVASQT